MDWAWDVGDMSEPAFLLLYGGVILATIGTCRFWSRRQDVTRNLPTPPIPSDFDAVEVAYLRGQEYAVTRLIVFGLLQRKYLRIVDTRKWSCTRQEMQQSEDRQDLGDLSRLERDVFDYFASPLSAVHVSPSLLRMVAAHCGEYQERCQGKNLLAAPKNREAAVAAILTGTLIIVGLGGFNLWGTLDEGFIYAVASLLITMTSLVILVVVCWMERRTNLGKRYLDQLQLAFRQSASQSGKGDGFMRGGCDGHLPQTSVPDAGMFVRMAVLGRSVLQGTEYASYFQEMLVPADGGVTCGG